jgi:hypothetical protein
MPSASADASRTMLVADAHAKRWPADVSQTRAVAAASANRTMPAASGLPRAGCNRSSPSIVRRRQTASAQSGTLTMKSQRQLAWWTTRPPITGPPTLARVKMIAK